MRIRDARQTFLGIWVRLLLEGASFEVWGGHQLRDFNFVADAVQAFLIAAADDRACGRVFNLGSREVVSLKELAEKLVAANGGGKYRVLEYPADRAAIDIGDYYSDFSQIESVLGWTPQTSLSDSLALILDYYRHNLAHYL
jgi:nucleoside-diphosphate-sugar epimerase